MASDELSIREPLFNFTSPRKPDPKTAYCCWKCSHTGKVNCLWRWLNPTPQCCSACPFNRQLISPSYKVVASFPFYPICPSTPNSIHIPFLRYYQLYGLINWNEISYRFTNYKQTSLDQRTFSFKGTHPCGRTTQIVPQISSNLWLPPIILMGSWTKQFFTAHMWRPFMIMPIIGLIIYSNSSSRRMKISWYLLFTLSKLAGRSCRH